MKTITLTGMMGSGKTSVAKLLAEKLNCGLLEIDSLIEKNEGRTISEIFAQSGEKYFRDIEKNVIYSSVKPEYQVVALGGGAFENKQTRDFLLKNTTVIYLKSSAETVFERIKNDTSRPLLKDNMTIEKINDIIKKRAKNYEKANFTITTNKKSLEEITTEIIGVLS